MKQLMMILFICLPAFSQNIHQELMIGGYHKRADAEAQLIKLDIYLMENGTLGKLKKQYKLHTGIRRIGEYEVVSIEPIDSIALKNRLMMALQPFFPNIFFIDSSLPVVTHTEKNPSTEKKSSHIMPDMAAKSEKDLVDQMGLQWFAILMLSIAGLILSGFRRNKVRYLQKIQKILGAKQSKIENEIKHMEDMHA